MEVKKERPLFSCPHCGLIQIRLNECPTRCKPSDPIKYDWSTGKKIKPKEKESS